MLGSALPATATLQTSTPNATPSSPTRTSRLRGLSYLRNYTHSHLHSNSSRENTPSLSRSRSSNALTGNSSSRTEDLSRRGQGQQQSLSEGIQSNESGWLPTVHGRSGLNRDCLTPAPTTEAASSDGMGMNRHRATNATSALTPAESRNTTMRRPSRNGAVPSIDSAASPPTTTQTVPEKSDPESNMPSIRFIPHMGDRSHQRPSLNFTAVTRTLSSTNSVVRVGRYSERDQTNTSHAGLTHPTAPSGSAMVPVGFKSKVVSRKHCEFWQSNGQWYVKDVKSSSGTFLNHVRLSGPGQESRPYPVTDGDLVQLGIDFKGGEEVIFRCVKIRVEINRGWQKSLNSFNTSEYKKIVNRSKTPKKGIKARDSDAASTNSSECSICLNPVAPCQALFVAPCSHVWHFKCIRNLINGPNFPNFLCPNCRFSADLEADVEPPEDYDGEDFEESGQEGMEDEIVVEEDDERGENGGVGVGDESDEGHAPGIAVIQRDLGSIEEDRPVQLPQPSQSKARSIRSPLESSTSDPLESSTSDPLESSTSDPLGARATTPTSSAQFALAAGVINMDAAASTDEDGEAGLLDIEPSERQDTAGPMTPRNDAGPFVLDGAGEGVLDASRTLQQELTPVPGPEDDDDHEGR